MKKIIDIPPKLKEQLECLAKKEDRSLCYMIIKSIRLYIEQSNLKVMPTPTSQVFFYVDNVGAIKKINKDDIIKIEP